jgi:hypothetical protein
MSAEQEMQQLKSRIAEVYARREQLKRALGLGELTPRAGFAQLDTVDRELSDLDSRFKTLWDAAHPSAASHPAVRWAKETAFEPVQLDCVAAIMLKVLDGKCKMTEADRTAITAVYDVVNGRPGERLGADVHGFIAAARRGMDDAMAVRIHGLRVEAEALIPKPVMKGFKQWLGTSMPRQ